MTIDCLCNIRHPILTWLIAIEAPMPGQLPPSLHYGTCDQHRPQLEATFR